MTDRMAHVLDKVQGVKSTGNGQYTARCPAHEDRHASLSVSEGQDGRILLCCHAGCPVEAILTAAGLTMADLFPEKNGNRPARPKGSAKPTVIRYEVRNHAGELVAIHERRENRQGKTFTWYRPDSSVGLDGQATRDLPLFGAHLLKEVPKGKAVVVCEGEKAAASLQGRGIPAVGTVTGAAATPGDEALRPLLEFPVVLWPDNDEPGRDHMGRVGNSLLRLGHRDVRVVNWPDAPAKGDAADFTGDLAGLLAPSVPFAAPETAGAASLLAEVRTFILRFIVVGEAEATALGLWVLHSHCFDAADCTPYLHVRSPEKECGKTRLLEVLALLVARPWLSMNTTAAALMRIVASRQPTAFLDEIDNTFGGDPQALGRIRALLNAGYLRGGVATVAEDGQNGWEVREFPVFCPKALAGIGRLPDTIESRCLPIEMRRRAGEPIEAFRRRKVGSEGATVRKRLEVWAPTVIDRLREARPESPEGLSDRQADVCEPLLAIADLAGGPWPERARLALVELCRHAGADDGSLGVKLLRDVREAFGDRDRMTSAALVEALVADEEAPWGAVQHGKALDMRGLANRLTRFGIKSGTIRLDGEHTAKGYYRTQFEDVWLRYLRPVPSPANVTESQPNVDGLFPSFSSVTREADVTDGKREIGNADGHCDDVTDKQPGNECSGDNGGSPPGGDGGAAAGGDGGVEPAPRQCHLCREKVFWRLHGDGNPWRCMTCHPPASGLDVTRSR